jgi:hypothetical protein
MAGAQKIKPTEQKKIKEKTFALTFRISHQCLSDKCDASLHWLMQQYVTEPQSEELETYLQEAKAAVSDITSDDLAPIRDIFISAMWYDELMYMLTRKDPIIIIPQEELEAKLCQLRALKHNALHLISMRQSLGEKFVFNHKFTFVEDLLVWVDANRVEEVRAKLRAISPEEHYSLELYRILSDEFPAAALLNDREFNRYISMSECLMKCVQVGELSIQ